MRDFFKVPAETSKIKSNIVFDYFKFWVSVLKNVPRADSRLGYIDLYAGKGKYDDGTDSTPMKIMKFVLLDKNIKDRMVFVLNDKVNIVELKNNLSSISGYETLKTEPIYESFTVEQDIANVFENLNLIPSLIFLDPFGLKGLSSSLFKNICNNWGCDLITFFNFSYTKRSLPNKIMSGYINDIFGEETATALRNSITTVQVESRHFEILEAYLKMIKVNGWKYVFTIELNKRNRQIYYLVLATKNIKAAKGMKDILRKYANIITMNSLCLFIFYEDINESFLDTLNEITILDLKNHLLKNYIEKEFNFKELFETDFLDTPFLEKEYRQALKELENEAKINIILSRTQRRIGQTFPDHVRFIFN